MYDVTKRSTFDDVMKWYSDLRNIAERECIIALVGNKVDLLDRNNRRREVSYEEGKKLAETNNMLFYEASALTSVKVNDCFEDLLQEIYNERRKVGNLRASSNSHTLELHPNEDENDSKCC